jgi:hypothetical protein
MKDDRGDKGARSRREQAIVKVLVFSAIFAPLRSQRFFQSFIEDAEYAEAQSRLRNNYKKFFPSWRWKFRCGSLCILCDLCGELIQQGS